MNKHLDINNLPDTLTVKEVAQLLRLKPISVHRWVHKGTIPVTRINKRGDLRFKREDIEKILNTTW